MTEKLSERMRMFGNHGTKRFILGSEYDRYENFCKEVEVLEADLKVLREVKEEYDRRWISGKKENDDLNTEIERLTDNLLQVQRRNYELQEDNNRLSQWCSDGTCQTRKSLESEVERLRDGFGQDCDDCARRDPILQLRSQRLKTANAVKRAELAEFRLQTVREWANNRISFLNNFYDTKGEMEASEEWYELSKLKSALGE